MCGIVGYLDKRGRHGVPSGRLILKMLEALACRGPDSAGVALLHDATESGDAWTIRIAPGDSQVLARLEGFGRVEASTLQAGSLRFQFHPAPGITADGVEAALGACRGGLEVLS